MEEQVEIKETETIEEEPTGGGIKEEVTIPLPSPVPLLPPVPKLPMGTITETITIPATIAPSYKPTKKKEVKKPIEEIIEIKKEPNGEIKIIREICDGEVHLGPFKSCLKEFTGISAVGWIAAAAGLIVLWKWLDYRFKK